MQTTYEAGYAGGHDFAKIMGQYADFQKLTPDMVHTLINRVIFFGEVEYAFSDEMTAFVELVESRKGEIACMQQEMQWIKKM